MLGRTRRRFDRIRGMHREGFSRGREKRKRELCAVTICPREQGGKRRVGRRLTPFGPGILPWARPHFVGRVLEDIVADVVVPMHFGERDVRSHSVRIAVETKSRMPQQIKTGRSRRAGRPALVALTML